MTLFVSLTPMENCNAFRPEGRDQRYFPSLVFHTLESSIGTRSLGYNPRLLNRYCISTSVAIHDGVGVGPSSRLVSLHRWEEAKPCPDVSAAFHCLFGRIQALYCCSFGYLRRCQALFGRFGFSLQV